MGHTEVNDDGEFRFELDGAVPADCILCAFDGHELTSCPRRQDAVSKVLPRLVSGKAKAKLKPKTSSIAQASVASTSSSAATAQPNTAPAAAAVAYRAQDGRILPGEVVVNSSEDEFYSAEE